MAIDFMQLAIDIALDTVRQSQAEYKARVMSEIQSEHSSKKKKNWAADIADSLVAEEPYYAPHSQKVIGKVYMPEDHDDGDYVRAMVLATGNQAGGPLFTKPGQKTWNGNIDEKSVHVPAGEKPEPLPESFNHPSGQNFMANATKLYRDRFNDNVLVAQRKIRDEIGKML